MNVLKLVNIVLSIFRLEFVVHMVLVLLVNCTVVK